MVVEFSDDNFQDARDIVDKARELGLVKVADLKLVKESVIDISHGR